MKRSLWQQGIYKYIEKIQCIPLNSIISMIHWERVCKCSEDAQALGAHLKEFGPGKLCVKKVWAQNKHIFINFRTELDQLNFLGDKKYIF